MTISTAISPTSIASGVGIDFNNLRFQQTVDVFSECIGIIGQASEGVTGFPFNEGYVITSDVQAGTVFGFGSPIHSMARVLYNSAQSVGTIPVIVWPVDKLTDATASTGSIEFVGTQTITQSYDLFIASQQISFTLLKGMTAVEAATLVKGLIDNNINLPLTSSSLSTSTIPLTSKWNGSTANYILMNLIGIESGITITITQMSGGTLIPDITTLLNNFGEVWQTLIVNQFDDTTSLNLIDTEGEALWDPTIDKPFVAFYGSVETDPATVSSDTDSVKTQRVNSKFPAPGSNSLTFEIAASIAALVAITADANPPRPYVDAILYGILPGVFADQWTYAQRDYIVKRGCSTSYINNGFVIAADVVTTYHPIGVDNPGYRYVVDVVKSQLVIFDSRAVFYGPNWQQTILVNDDDQVTNPVARKASDALTAMYGLIDKWADDAVIVNRDFCKSNSSAQRDSVNPNRINCAYSLLYSGATRIVSITVNFSLEVGAGV